MRTLAAQVREFKLAAGQHLAEKPSLPPDEVVDFCLGLIDEERRELEDAFGVCVPGGSVAEVADAICDLLYVMTGLGLAMGLPLPELMDEVQRANMAKFGPGSHKDPATGKQLKPPGWTPPDIEGVLTRSAAQQTEQAQETHVSDQPPFPVGPATVKRLSNGWVTAQDVYHELSFMDLNGDWTFYIDRIMEAAAQGKVRVVRTGEPG
jgi:predicted HAD superfamily Cof-like phosphohydrolase